MKSKIILALLICLSFGHTGVSEPTPTILFGMSSAQSGPAGDLGRNMKLGIETYFQHFNTQNKLNGKKVKLITEDDGYNPESAKVKVKKLIANKKIMALIGNVGTPTALATVPIINQEKIALLGPLTGSNFFRDSKDLTHFPYVFSLRSSYQQEMQIMIDGLLKMGVFPKEIAFFIQDDAYGMSGLNAAKNVLKTRGYASVEDLAVGKYTRNTIDITQSLISILNAKTHPKAVIMVSTSAPAIKFIQTFKKSFPKTLFLNLSFVGSNALIKGLDKGFYLL